MMAGILVSPGMEMKTPGSRLFKINETSVAEKPGDQPDDDQQTGDRQRRARRQAESMML